MTTESASPAPISKAALWTGQIMSYLPSLLLIFSGVMKIAKPPGLVDGFTHFGIPLSQAVGIGILEIACTLLYLVPRTAVLGAILLTGYLGGAIMTNLRVGDPVIVIVILGVVIWGGLFLRDRRVRELIPLRR